MTRAKTSGGKIVDHRDYRDLDELLVSPLSAGGRILQALRSVLA